MVNYFPSAPVVVALLIANSLLSFWGFRDEAFREKLLLNPYDVRIDRRYFTWLTCGFVHANPFHLFANMLTLFFFGPMLEFHLGSLLFALVYLAGLLAGSAGTHLRYLRNSSYPGTLGASGAISAVVLGAIAVEPSLGLSLPGLTLLHPALVLPGWIAGALLLALSLLFMLLPKEEKVMNHDAHFWGAIVGLVICLIAQPEGFQAWSQALTIKAFLLCFWANYSGENLEANFFPLVLVGNG